MSIELTKTWSLTQVNKAIALLTRPYQTVWSADEKYIAQSLLSGKSHYYDDGTMRAFKARISEAYLSNDTLLFITCESYENYDKKRLHRFVCFDVFGTVVFRANVEDTIGYTTKKQAKKVFNEWYLGFDVLAHYRETIYRKYNNMVDKTNELTSLLTCFE